MWGRGGPLQQSVVVFQPAVGFHGGVEATVFVHAGPGGSSAAAAPGRSRLLVTDHSGSISATGSVTG